MFGLKEHRNGAITTFNAEEHKRFKLENKE